MTAMLRAAACGPANSPGNLPLGALSAVHERHGAITELNRNAAHVAVVCGRAARGAEPRDGAASRGALPQPPSPLCSAPELQHFHLIVCTARPQELSTDAPKRGSCKE